MTTHQVEEIEHVLTDVMFIGRGRIVFDCSMEELESRYLEVAVHPERVAAARALKPIQERQVFGRSILLFDAVDGRQLAALGEVRRPSIVDGDHNLTGGQGRGGVHQDLARVGRDAGHRLGRVRRGSRRGARRGIRSGVLRTQARGRAVPVHAPAALDEGPGGRSYFRRGAGMFILGGSSPVTRAAQRSPRWTISRASGTPKSAATWPREV